VPETADISPSREHALEPPARRVRGSKPALRGYKLARAKCTVLPGQSCVAELRFEPEVVDSGIKDFEEPEKWIARESGWSVRKGGDIARFSVTPILGRFGFSWLEQASRGLGRVFGRGQVLRWALDLRDERTTWLRVRWRQTDALVVENGRRQMGGKPVPAVGRPESERRFMVRINVELARITTVVMVEPDRVLLTDSWTLGEPRSVEREIRLPDGAGRGTLDQRFRVLTAEVIRASPRAVARAAIPRMYQALPSSTNERAGREPSRRTRPTASPLPTSAEGRSGCGISAGTTADFGLRGSVRGGEVTSAIPMIADSPPEW